MEDCARGTQGSVRPRGGCRVSTRHALAGSGPGGLRRHLRERRPPQASSGSGRRTASPPRLAAAAVAERASQGVGSGSDLSSHQTSARRRAVQRPQSTRADAGGGREWVRRRRARLNRLLHLFQRAQAGGFDKPGARTKRRGRADAAPTSSRSAPDVFVASARAPPASTERCTSMHRNSYVRPRFYGWQIQLYGRAIIFISKSLRR